MCCEEYIGNAISACTEVGALYFINNIYDFV